MTTTELPTAPRKPSAPGRSNSKQEAQFQVKRVIKEEPAAQDESTPSEREREMRQQISDLRREILTLKNQVSRLQRFDGKHAKMSEHQMFQAVVQSNLALSEQLGQLLGRSNDVTEVDPLTSLSLDLQELDHERHRKRVTEVAKNVAYTDRLTRATQIPTEQCPCGKHQGIMFVEGEIILEGNMCPKNWWFALSNRAYYYGELGAFMQDTPLKEYLKQWEQ